MACFARITCVVRVACRVRRSEESELSHVALRFRKADAKDAFLPAAKGDCAELAGSNLVADECLAHARNRCQFSRRQRCTLFRTKISEHTISGRSMGELGPLRHRPLPIRHVQNHTSKDCATKTARARRCRKCAAHERRDASAVSKVLAMRPARRSQVDQAASVMKSLEFNPRGAFCLLRRDARRPTDHHERCGGRVDDWIQRRVARSISSSRREIAVSETVQRQRQGSPLRR